MEQNSQHETARTLMDFAVEKAMKGDPSVIRKAQETAEKAVEYVAALREAANKEAHQVAGENLQGFRLCRDWVARGDYDPELQQRINMICDSQSVLTIERMIRSLDFAAVMVPDHETTGKGVREILESFKLMYKMQGQRRAGPEEYAALADWVKDLVEDNPEMTWTVSTMIKSQAVVTMDQLLSALRKTVDQLGMVLATRQDLDAL